MIQEDISLRCHCGLDQFYKQCCGAIITGESVAITAQSLMRSRYSAFVDSDEDYLLATWHPQTRPSKVRFSSDQRWLGLAIKSTRGGLEDDEEGQVEFVARYKITGKGYRLHEHSRFKKIEGMWYYLDGEHL
ncbi:MAG: SEC-C motif-containing protein [Halioglobus sp.]|jgi:SEC-C motif-containing protein